MTAHTHAETMAELARQEKVLADATAGPWTTQAIGSEGWHVYGKPRPTTINGRTIQMTTRPARCTEDDFDGCKADAALIVQAVNHDPVRLAVARELLTEHDRWLIVQNQYCSKCSSRIDKCVPRLRGARLVWGAR